MPPLALYLAPQIMARARDIEAELGPPQPVQAGYLAQQNIGFEKTPYDPRGLVDKPESKFYDPRLPAGAMLEGVRVMQRSGEPIAQKVGRAFLAGAMGKTVGKQGDYYAPQAGQATDAKKGGRSTQSMVVPMPGASEPIGMTERGEPVYAPVPTAPTKPKVLKLEKGKRAGFDEKGESVDPKGKKMGYLSSGSVGGPGRSQPLRDLARRTTDAPMDGRDAFGAQALKRLYEPHLKAVQEHFQDTGKEAFPPGYFNGMSETEKANIKQGVEALRAMERGTRA